MHTQMQSWRSLDGQSVESHQRHSSHSFWTLVRPAVLWKEFVWILLNSSLTAMNMPDMTQLSVIRLLCVFFVFGFGYTSSV